MSQSANHPVTAFPVYMGTYPGSVLVCLKSNVKHLTGLLAILVHQLIADSQQSREADFDDLFELRTVVCVAHLIAERTADSEQTLQASENSGGVVGVQQLNGVIHESRPSLGEVEVQDALKNGDKLVADQSLGAGEDGQ